MVGGGVSWLARHPAHVLASSRGNLSVLGGFVRAYERERESPRAQSSYFVALVYRVV